MWEESFAKILPRHRDRKQPKAFSREPGLATVGGKPAYEFSKEVNSCIEHQLGST